MELALFKYVTLATVMITCVSMVKATGRMGSEIPMSTSGMCMMEMDCDSCPEDRKATVYTMKRNWYGLPVEKMTRTVCCPNCAKGLQYTQSSMTYSCNCQPEDTCWRNTDCDGCDPRFVTNVYGTKYCCKNCKKAGLTFSYTAYGMSTMCDCNVPVVDEDATTTPQAEEPTTTTQAVAAVGYGEDSTRVDVELREEGLIPVNRVKMFEEVEPVVGGERKVVVVTKSPPKENEDISESPMTPTSDSPVKDSAEVKVSQVPDTENLKVNATEAPVTDSGEVSEIPNVGVTEVIDNEAPGEENVEVTEKPEEEKSDEVSPVPDVESDEVTEMPSMEDTTANVSQIPELESVEVSETPSVQETEAPKSVNDKVDVSEEVGAESSSSSTNSV